MVFKGFRVIPEQSEVSENIAALTALQQNFRYNAPQLLVHFGLHLYSPR